MNSRPEHPKKKPEINDGQAEVIQEPKPLVRMTGENGCVIYPKMIPDGKGGWKMADPAAVARMLGTPEPPALENQ